MLIEMWKFLIDHDGVLEHGHDTKSYQIKSSKIFWYLFAEASKIQGLVEVKFEKVSQDNMIRKLKFETFKFKHIFDM